MRVYDAVQRFICLSKQQHKITEGYVSAVIVVAVTGLLEYHKTMTLTSFYVCLVLLFFNHYSMMTERFVPPTANVYSFFFFA